MKKQSKPTHRGGSPRQAVVASARLAQKTSSLAKTAAEQTRLQGLWWWYLPQFAKYRKLRTGCVASR